jgi:hypothetical protein
MWYSADGRRIKARISKFAIDSPQDNHIVVCSFFYDDPVTRSKTRVIVSKIWSLVKHTVADNG